MLARRLLFAAGSGSFADMGQTLYLDARNYGARLDCRGVQDAAVAGGALTTVTSATAAFTSADTGKTYTLADEDGNVTTGTLTYSNSTTATMSTAAAGAVTDGRLIFGADDTSAWQDALDAALPGQFVHATPFSWRSLIAGQLSIPAGVNLGFSGEGPYNFTTYNGYSVPLPVTCPAMTTFGPTFVAIGDATTAAFTLQTNSGLGDFILYDAGQIAIAYTTPIAKAPMVKLAIGSGHCRVGNLTIPNAYYGVWVQGGVHHVGNILSGCFKAGVVIDHCYDTVFIESIVAEEMGSLTEDSANNIGGYYLNNAWALIAYRADGFLVDRIGGYGMYGGVLMTDSADTSFEVGTARCGYGVVNSVLLDSFVYPIRVKSTNTPGLLVGQAMFSANSLAYGPAGDIGVWTEAGGTMTPEVTVGSWSHWGTWGTGASHNDAGTLNVPATNPG